MVLIEPCFALILFILLSWKMGFTFKNTAMVVFKRYQSEKCWSSFVTVDVGVGSVIVITQAFTFSLTSGSSLLIFQMTTAVQANLFWAPRETLSQRCCSFSTLASNLREALLAGFSFVSTYLHWLRSARLWIINFGLDWRWKIEIISDCCWCTAALLLSQCDTGCHVFRQVLSWESRWGEQRRWQQSVPGMGLSLLEWHKVCSSHQERAVYAKVFIAKM